MMRRALFVTLSLCAFLVCPAALEAQNIPSPYRYIEQAQSIGLFAGYLYTQSGELDLAPRSAPLVGARYVGRFAGPASAVLSLAAMPSERTIYARTDIANLDAPLTKLGDADATMLIAQAGLRLGITGPRTWRGFAPFVGTTIGLVTNLSSHVEQEAGLPENQLIDAGPSFAVGISAGTDWFLTERLSIQAGAEDQIWRLSIPEGLSTTAKGESNWTQNIGVTLGAAFHF